ncbi:nitroreductase [Bacillus sp. SA1-12]|uniref:nitroreductase family protein n=1 Tax=Bacillus sp. SA1-12 TaxID=1455638 RepID=UPI000625520E|nr:nitroreductase family protein [Bacillus sp. SA1-12]KKI91998.1 nitroreductase [Bacillus sp. SA1-12]
MEFIHVVNNRREISSFTEQSIPKEIIEEILEVAWLSPTGNNLPSREFIVVKDRVMLDHLANTTPYMPWLKEANAGIVITGRLSVGKYWIQDSSIASGYIWLAAVNAGLGCAFGAVFNAVDEVESEQREAYVRNALNIPKDRRVLTILGLGYAKEKPNKKDMISKNEIIYFDSFRSKND